MVGVRSRVRRGRRQLPLTQPYGPEGPIGAPACSPVPTVPLMLCSRPGTLHDFHSHEIAEQLTLLDAELFYKIEV